jgi:two-component system cell cycle sensor histidine kinase/response regulator CckA
VGATPYRILLVEDNENDAILLGHVLQCGETSFSLTRVETREQFEKAIKNEQWDVVLSDCLLPTFNAEQALEIVNASQLDLPFIVVSGKVDEDDVTAILRAGAEHFVSKDDMRRLPIAIERAVAGARRRQAIARELAAHREHLEELVAARTGELKEANQKLQVEVGERRRVEEALRDSEMQYRGLVENALDGICIIQDQKLQFANQQLAGMVARDVDNIVGANFMDLFPAEEAERMMGLYRRVAKGEEDGQRYESSVVSKRGRHLDASVGVSAIEYHGRRAVMMVIRDISEQKRSRRIALENERLEAVGIVARGVGNNFTNIMSVINSYAASIADSFLPHTRPHNAASKILDASRHASDLTKRLLSVVRVSETETQTQVEPVDLGDAIEKARDLVGHALRARNVNVVLKHRGPMPYIMADQSQLLDTLMNIFLNGADAMPKGGTLTIALVERRISKPRSNPNATGGQFVGLSIQDDGVGMSKEQIQHVFEPFFTTKESEEAFGLGLPVAQSMAQSWGGWIDIRSRLGKGTRVRIFMPKAEAPTESEVAKQKETGPLTILVVDDNAGRRQLMEDALEALGHRSIMAASGEDAIELHRQHADKIDLYVVDWIMPGKDGKSVLQAVLDHDPQAKVIMLSGFSRDYVRSEIRMGAWSFLQKPFSAEEFAASVAEAHKRKVL